MKAVVLKETRAGEQRVALVPGGVEALRKRGIDVAIEAGSGVAAGYPDEAYRLVGADVSSDRRGLAAAADLLLAVDAPLPTTHGELLSQLKPECVILAMADPLGNAPALAELATRGQTLFALELIPRITRAQSMDVLSSMATVAGYKAVLLAANLLPKMFPLLMTAAGTVTPAKVLVLGAGVAGLQAIATAKRLGGVVSAYDVRPAAREQIESLGAKCVQLDLATADAEDRGGYAKSLGADQEERQRQQLAEHAAIADVIITTAAIPGKPSPRLISAAAVRRMAAGSVIVDLAAERGGNCELTQANATINVDGVTITGPTNLASEVPGHASQLYSKNLTNLVALMVKDGQLKLDMSDQVIRETMATHRGQVVHSRLREMLGLAPLDPPATATPPVEHLAKG